MSRAEESESSPLLLQGMSYDGGDVFTMMIKQDSRDSNVYDAPTFIPDIQVVQ